MSWDEALFGWFYRRVGALANPRPRPDDLARSAHLADLAPRLALVASALSGETLRVRPAESLGGATDGVLHLPTRIDLGPDRPANTQVYLHRVVCGVAAIRRGLYLPPGASPSAALVWTALAQPALFREARAMLPGFETLRQDVAAWERARRPDLDRLAPREAALETLVRARLADDFGGEAYDDPEALTQAVTGWTETLHALATRRGSVVPPVVSWGLLMGRGEASGGSRTKQPRAADSALPQGTERPGKPRDRVRRVEMGKDRVDENPLTHSFEKVHTAEEYKGGRKAVDGSDEMASHGEALDELEMREVIRSNETTRSLYRADVMLDGSTGELDGDPDPQGLPYPEWNASTHVWRPAWCSVRVEVGAATVPADRAHARVQAVLHRHRDAVRILRAEFERMAQGRAWRNRQLDGPDVDTDALVDRHACLRAGHSPPDRLYVSRRRRSPDVATLVLLDASLSADAWVGGRRVLDVARDAVIVLGEVLAGLHDELGVAAFHSNTRRDCRFTVLKGFAEPWPRAFPRLASVQPRGYTRIGPALRHATALLARTRARTRMLLLVTDGRPTDYDRYEGRYGVADVAMAVREADSAGVKVFALAVEAQARSHLGEMFGRGRYAVMPRPEALVDAMAAVYRQALGR